MQRVLWFSFMLFMTLILGCDSGTEEAKAPNQKSDHIYSGQKKVLDAAKEVSVLSREVAEQKRKSMEDAK